MKLALLLSIGSVSAFSFSGTRPTINVRSSRSIVMSHEAHLLADVTNLVAAVPQARDITFGIGANAPNWASADGEGSAVIFGIAAAGLVSIIARNGSGGLSPATGGWDNNKSGSTRRGGRKPFKTTVSTTPNGVVKVRFPVDGGAERGATGQAGAPLLLTGFFPVILEISRVMNLPQ